MFRQEVIVKVPDERLVDAKICIPAYTCSTTACVVIDTVVVVGKMVSIVQIPCTACGSTWNCFGVSIALLFVVY